MKQTKTLIVIIAVLGLILVMVWGTVFLGVARVVIEKIVKSNQTSEEQITSEPSSEGTQIQELKLPEDALGESLDNEQIGIEEQTNNEDQVSGEEQTNVDDQTTGISYQSADVAGTWYVTYRRYYSMGYEEGYELLGLDEVFITMTIYDGNEFEYEILPTQAFINGEEYNDTLAKSPKLYTGYIDGDSLMLYTDLDDFYLEFGMEATETIEPDYIRIPLSVQNGKLSGVYETTWNKDIEGHDMKYTVTFEMVQE